PGTLPGVCLPLLRPGGEKRTRHGRGTLESAPRPRWRGGSLAALAVGAPQPAPARGSRRGSGGVLATAEARPGRRADHGAAIHLVGRCQRDLSARLGRRDLVIGEELARSV